MSNSRPHQCNVKTFSVPRYVVGSIALTIHQDGAVYGTDTSVNTGARRAGSRYTMKLEEKYHLSKDNKE